MTRPIRVFAWISVLVQLLNVLSGAAVRLTGSGLGCPSFPECTPGSLVVTPEMGIHGLIEFGNRMVAVVLTLVCIVTFLLVVRLRRTRPELFWLAFAIGLGIPAEAIIGGMSVLTGLNPYVVGLHFVVSVVLIALSTVLLYRVYDSAGPYRVSSTPLLWRLALGTAVAAAVTIVVGIVTTGSGPHAGDATAPRNGLDPAVLEHLHSYPAYAMLALSLVVLYVAWRERGESVAFRFAVLLLGIELVQILVGIVQVRLAVPAILVGVHMILACLLAIAVTAMVLSLTTSAVPTGSAPAQNGSRGSIPTATNSTVK
ncbi:COX15/CtaA family protein [Parafrigoribacterium mesophilum]|uniref:COX15/CtaA family protein n=1 Tax=Parafrigoribacterium mesophilum TaxID=433646 RepID=UPI0031FDB9F1